MAATQLSEAEARRVISKAGSPLAAHTEWPPNLYRKRLAATVPDDPSIRRRKIGTTELRNLQMQLGVLQSLKRGIRVIDDLNAMAKAATVKRDYAAEKNYLRAAGHHTQSLLAHNEPELQTLETAIELLNKIEPASPEQQSADYLQRRF